MPSRDGASAALTIVSRRTPFWPASCNLKPDESKRQPPALTFARSLPLLPVERCERSGGPGDAYHALGSFPFPAVRGTAPAMIELTSEGGVARLLLNRPAVRNALAVEHWEDLADAVAGLQARLLVVSGAGGAFSAGADISEFGALESDVPARTRFRTSMRRGIDAIASLAIPTVAWINGPCFGAGVALAMACDVRVADPAARFAITPAKMGIGYPQEDVARLVALVGPGGAARLLFTGEAIDAAEAERIGLIELRGGEAALGALTDALLACDSDSIAMLKRGIRLAVQGIAADAEQDRCFEALLGSTAFAERLSRMRIGAGLRGGRG